MYKKGEAGEIVWGGTAFLFVMLVLIGGGIIAGLYLFYGQGYDGREADAEILGYKIRSCLMGNDISDEFFNVENFFEKCNLNKAIIEEDFIIRICKDSGECIKEVRGVIDVGSNFQECGLKSVRGERALKCSSSKFEKEGSVFEIVTGSRQFIRRK